MNQHCPPIHEINAVASNVRTMQIDPDPRNPRTFFDPNELDDLTASIKARGLLQRILVRRMPKDRYMIVFGERRWRAFTKAYGDAEMPVFICEMSDEEALAAQIDENEIRVEPSETEQAAAAARVLQACDGDRLEAIRRLGWPATKFDRRLALNKLSDAAKTALNERRIKLGHAELLAAIPPEKQDKALDTILSSGIDVAATRDLLARIANDLAAAKFDKSECAGCTFNSSLQRTLFETTVSDGACTNPTCYELKTVQAEQQAAPKATKTPVPVGGDQPKTTEIETHHPSTAAAKTPAAAKAAVVAKPKPAKPHEPSADGETSAHPTPDLDDNSYADERASCYTKAKQMRESAWRRATARLLAESPDHAKTVLIMAAFNGELPRLSRTTLMYRADQLIAPNFTKARADAQFSTVAGLDAGMIERANCAIAASYAIDIPDFDRVAVIATACGVDIRPIWKADKTFLELYTKAELKFIALESGFVSVIGPKAFSKLALGKREGIIEAMMTTSGFDWAGRLPSAMTIDKRYGPPPQPVAATQPIPSPSKD